MKRITPLLLILFLSIISCNEDNDNTLSQASITFRFSHNWDGTPVTNADFDDIKFTSANDDQLSIERLRYLISKITFTTSNNEKLVLSGYNLVDVTNNGNLSFIPNSTIPTGTYSSVSFTFGFNNDDNYNNNYIDLNSASWIVPPNLGGGYHFMQLEGRFIDNTTAVTGYAYHAIRAVNNTITPQKFQDTFFEVNLGEITIHNNATFSVEMNIAEWFKNPNTWNLNVLNNMLMPNFDAQVMMFENGLNVFSLKSVNQ